jgi:hypothetical protein
MFARGRQSAAQRPTGGLVLSAREMAWWPVCDRDGLAAVPSVSPRHSGRGAPPSTSPACTPSRRQGCRGRSVSRSPWSRRHRNPSRASKGDRRSRRTRRAARRDRHRHVLPLLNVFFGLGGRYDMTVAALGVGFLLWRLQRQPAWPRDFTSPGVRLQPAAMSLPAVGGLSVRKPCAAAREDPRR